MFLFNLVCRYYLRCLWNAIFFLQIELFIFTTKKTEMENGKTTLSAPLAKYVDQVILILHAFF